MEVRLCGRRYSYQATGFNRFSCTGIEMGQGIHTKIAQVCAYELGVDLDLVSSKSTNNLLSPNQGPSGGSITSELVSMVRFDPSPFFGLSNLSFKPDKTDHSRLLSSAARFSTTDWIP